MDFKLSKFLAALDNYINVTLKNFWGFKETYTIKLIKDGVILNSNGPRYDLVLILKLDNYMKLFKSVMLSAFEKVYPDAKRYGIYIDLILPHPTKWNADYSDYEIKIQSKIFSYLDIVPMELLVIIISNLLLDSHFPYDSTNLFAIDSMINRSSRDLSTIYNELVRYYDSILTEGKLWKWVKPVPSTIDGKIKNFDRDDYTSLFDAFKFSRQKIDYTKENVKLNILNPNEKWQGKRILNFLSDETANFNEINGFAAPTYRHNSVKYIFSEYSDWYYLIKLRQFFPYFIGIPHETKFADNYYKVKLLQSIGEAIKGDVKLISYIEIGNLLEVPENVNGLRVIYILNSLLYDKKFHFNSFEEYLRVIDVIGYMRQKLFVEYKKYIPKDKLDLLIEKAKQGDENTLYLVHELMIDEKDKIVDYNKARKEVDRKIGLNYVYVPPFRL